MRSFHIRIVGILFCGFVSVVPGEAPAENPTIEKCTCDTVPSDVPDNGTWVVNATSCWSSEDRERQWCDITVQSLEGSGLHGTIVGALFHNLDDSTALTGVFQDRFRQFLETQATAGTVPVNFDEASSRMPAILAANIEQLHTCLTVFREASTEKGGLMTEGPEFHCRVGEVSGWLRVEFRIGDYWLAYMLAPND